MSRASKKQIDKAYQEGVRAALDGQPGAPTPYDDPERGWAWMAGYDSTDPRDCKPINESDPTDQRTHHQESTP